MDPIALIGSKVVKTGPKAGQAGPLLAVRNVGISFGGIVALDDVSFDLRMAKFSD